MAPKDLALSRYAALIKDLRLAPISAYRRPFPPILKVASLSTGAPLAPLESVSLCTRFSGFSTISSFGLNRLSSKLVGMFLEIVPMLVAKDFVRDCFVAQIQAKMCVRAGIRAYLRD